MKLSTLSVLILVSSLVVLSKASVESTLESLLDGIEQGTTVVSHPVLVLIFELISLLCPSVKTIGFTLEKLTGLLESQAPDLETLSLLYTTPNGTSTYNISSAATGIVSNPYFNASRRVYIFIHGFTSEANTTRYQELSADLLGIGETNILALDASELLEWWYLRASSYTFFIGGKLAEIIIAMVNSGVDPANVHLIGHSLGAHIAGFTGKNFTNQTGGEKVGRITGLDPAGPCFAYLKALYKLNSTDATFVDVIHSDAGVLGITDDVGHVNYWPNGGSIQPGCTSESCNHGRAVQYFIESINSTESYPARKCSSYWQYTFGWCDDNDLSYMGYGSTNSSSGKYYLKTNSESPYGLGTTDDSSTTTDDSSTTTDDSSTTTDDSSTTTDDSSTTTDDSSTTTDDSSTITDDSSTTTDDSSTTTDDSSTTTDDDTSSTTEATSSS